MLIISPLRVYELRGQLQRSQETCCTCTSAEPPGKETETLWLCQGFFVCLFVDTKGRQYGQILSTARPVLDLQGFFFLTSKNDIAELTHMPHINERSYPEDPALLTAAFSTVVLHVLQTLLRNNIGVQNYTVRVFYICHKAHINSIFERVILVNCCQLAFYEVLIVWVIFIKYECNMGWIQKKTNTFHKSLSGCYIYMGCRLVGCSESKVCFCGLPSYSLDFNNFILL